MFIEVLIRRLPYIPLLLGSLTAFGQSSVESQRIAEYYDLLSKEVKASNKHVLIYDYKISKRRSYSDSTWITRILLEQEKNQQDYQFDTVGNKVVKFELDNGSRRPINQYILDEKGRIKEFSIINNKQKPLSKVFYTYSNDLLIKEETFTGYAYLDEPRKLSIINYKYENGHLVQRDKKYSLNGSHWVQTWVSKYDSLGNNIWTQETKEGKVIIYENEFKLNRLIKSLITSTDDNPAVKEIIYDPQGYPQSIYEYTKRNNKPRRLTKFFYQ